MFARVSSGPTRSRMKTLSRLLTSSLANPSVIKKNISTFMFVGALRARVYDDEVRKFVEGLGVEKISKRLVNSREGPPVFEQPEMTLEKLMEYGNMLVMEQENVKRVRQESPTSLCNLRCR